VDRFLATITPAQKASTAQNPQSSDRVKPLKSSLPHTPGVLAQNVAIWGIAGMALIK